MITSASNNQIKNLIALQKKAKVRNSQKEFVIEGIKMFEETSQEQLVKAYVTETFYQERIQENTAYFDGFSYEIVADKIFCEVADTTTPQGVLAIVKQPAYDYESLITAEHANLLLLEDVRDPGNMGTIIRTAEGAGITGIVISKESVDIFNPKVVRSTMGALYRMPFVYVDHFVDALREMKQQGITIYASHLSATNYYDEEVYESKTGIIIGNEANGISEEVSKEADRLIKIPMEGKVESLNAGVAASILMYEVYRQKRNKRSS
ncbi:23S rRNA (guanosine(2251)-2'-O)-methyltransferase RlmB [Anaerosporobacter faecicola]|uniref:23S rRNA (guanosine(2251)-2'-O)-methyltransferase RlmB n=1 Tax=Anaerosporobacter faecicola TaxID=2718714 RepID=UPI001438A063|nr:23S rRNA (guanosine(2251)-2'-O)-methyltransferase RlmB [Anaerosporobacter faecicola]